MESIEFTMEESVKQVVEDIGKSECFDIKKFKYPFLNDYRKYLSEYAQQDWDYYDCDYIEF